MRAGGCDSKGSAHLAEAELGEAADAVDAAVPLAHADDLSERFRASEFLGNAGRVLAIPLVIISDTE